jgi:hypothetical protein
MKLESIIEAETRRGLKYLRKHLPQKAVLHFRRGLDLCQPDNKDHLCKILYFLGVSLQKLGIPGGALKSWSTASKVKKHSYSSYMLKRFANDYGMPRQVSKELDDYKAFYSVQLVKYLNTKQCRRIITEAEGDMIKELISDHWKVLKEQIALSALEPKDKIVIFSRVKIVFPFYLDNAVEPNKTLDVDFVEKKRLYPETRCRCGSGLPYKLCCGRTPGQDELAIGVF